MPVAVAARIRRRQRAPQVRANCWAAPPPQEIPENVGLRMTIVVEDRCREPRNAGHSIRAIRQRRVADARDVERDDFALGHPARDRLEQLDVAADPVEQQQRNAVAAPTLAPDPQLLPVHLQHLRPEWMVSGASRRFGGHDEFVWHH